MQELLTDVLSHSVTGGGVMPTLIAVAVLAVLWVLSDKGNDDDTKKIEPLDDDDPDPDSVIDHADERIDRIRKRRK